MIQNRALFQFQPFSKKQKQILTWWLPESPVSDCNGIIADGAIRSGKTVSMALSFVLFAMHNFEYKNFAMCGKTIGSFRRNVLAVLKNMLLSRGYILEEHRSDNMIEIKRNGVINYFYIFGGKDERSQDLIQGITLAGVFFDEVALMPESFVNQATGRCSENGSKYWFNCNPNSPKHWFKQQWIDEAENKNLLYLHFTMDDNLSLSEEIKKRYKEIYATGVFYRRYILGEWVGADGLVYPMFEESKHVISHIEGTGQCYISIDYGTRNPCVFLLWRLNKNTAVCIKEYYYDSSDKNGYQKTDEEYYNDLEKFAEGYAIQKIIIDPSASSFKTTIKRHGKYIARDADNSVLDGIRLTATLLQSGHLYFHESCKNTIEEFGAYVWDEDSTEDAVIKEYDHAMDAMRYFVQTIMRRIVKFEGV